MPYPKHLINDNETVALDLRPHWWFFSRHILTGIPLLLIIIVVLSDTSSGSFGPDALRWIVGILVLVWAAWLGIKYLDWARTYFVVTSDRVIFRTGVLSRHGVEIPLERINNINYNQRLFERMIGAGNLEVQSAGEQGTSTFDFVRHPDGVQQEIYRQMEGSAKKNAGYGSDAIAQAVRDTIGSGGGGGAAAASIPQQIEQLAQLRDQGRITPQEYEAKKAQLLERM
jgi:membrane protein YdbS with pleckstrin-like domain